MWGHGERWKGFSKEQDWIWDMREQECSRGMSLGKASLCTEDSGGRHRDRDTEAERQDKGQRDKGYLDYKLVGEALSFCSTFLQCLTQWGLGQDWGS